MVSRVVSEIPKYPPRKSQSDFTTDPTPEDKFHHNLVMIDADVPFSKPKIVANEITRARNQQQFKRFSNSSGKQFGAKAIGLRVN